MSKDGLCLRATSREKRQNRMPELHGDCWSGVVDTSVILINDMRDGLYISFLSLRISHRSQNRRAPDPEASSKAP